MKKVLLVGDHPQGMSGNSHMMKAIIEWLDKDKYQVVCYSETPPPILTNPFVSSTVPIIHPTDMGDQYGSRRLLEILGCFPIDVLMFVGIDLWHHASIWGELVNLRNKYSFKWIAIFPYDLTVPRNDWIQWINDLDAPCVYSLYGLNLLKEYSPKISYFRPPMLNADMYKPFTKEEREDVKRRHFAGHVTGKFVFGFVGNNQIRKDPQRAIKAFFELKKSVPEICLYLHMDITRGVYNIAQYIEDCGGQVGDILIKNQSTIYTDDTMVEVYNAIDCLVNTSLQEGLSWTILQAMLCKTPVIGAYNTAQMELLDHGCIQVDCDELTYVPVISVSGPTYVETRACNYDLLVSQMYHMCKGTSEENTVEAYLHARDWVCNLPDANLLIENTLIVERIEIDEKLNKILFMQHSSAGDVFMTTRCFKGLRERHLDTPLVYMTQPQYQDIIEGNPYVDEIIDWNPKEASKYAFVYNPHGERIAPGHWGRNCNSILSDFYWKILNVEPDDFFIELKQPDIDIMYEVLEGMEIPKKPILVVHTTGGNPFFRTYKYMRDICQAMEDKYLTIQLGAKSDYPAWAKIDLRGKLSFRETAWVMSKAKMAVTVDSFISHLAGALGISQVCLFGSGNYVVVQPKQVSGKLICMSPDYVSHCRWLGPCSGVIAECPVPCTSRHDPKDILKHLDYLEKWLGLKEFGKDEVWVNPISLGGK